MEGFSKSYIRNRSSTPVIKDEYDKDVQNAARKSLMIESRSFVEFAGKKEAAQFIKRSYILVGLGFIGSAVSYPLAVRFVKKVFGFKTFFNINFAAFPIVLNANALLLGSLQGFFNYMEVTQNYNVGDSSSDL